MPPVAELAGEDYRTVRPTHQGLAMTQPPIQVGQTWRRNTDG